MEETEEALMSLCNIRVARGGLTVAQGSILWLSMEVCAMGHLFSR